MTSFICLSLSKDFGCQPALLTSLFFCVLGFHRNEDMKAIDVLPILKEKVAFLSGQIYTVQLLNGHKYVHSCTQYLDGHIFKIIPKSTQFPYFVD